ncbi:MAG: Eco29kI family restriction endonuclease [Candidatus Hydrogenedentes bacterium]|nr:Eco29kI family restriction endonuclease [Candidatus Hydrogenedentota bacterium]
MPATPDIDGFRKLLRELLESLPKVDQVKAARRNVIHNLKSEIDLAIQKLDEFAKAVDPIKQPVKVFDPSDPHTIGQLIALTLLEQPRLPLASIESFYGSGVYAVYYKGDFPAYVPISGTDTPIYVGKADPATHNANRPEEQGSKLYIRLTDHLRSIRAATNLSDSDFDIRCLVVKSAWQSTAETYLISHFKPIWNNEVKICFGFGKHGDSAKTRGNKVSPWDTVHPGRSWAIKAGNFPNDKTAAQILDEIGNHFVKYPPMKMLEAIPLKAGDDEYIEKLEEISE